MFLASSHLKPPVPESSSIPERGVPLSFPEQATWVHQLPVGAASHWCLLSARTGSRPRLDSSLATLFLSVIRNKLFSSTEGSGRGLALRMEAFASVPLPDTCPFSEQCFLSLPHLLLFERMSLRLAISADTESPVPAGEGRDQLSLLRTPGSFSFLILAPC